MPERIGVDVMKEMTRREFLKGLAAAGAGVAAGMAAWPFGTVRASEEIKMSARGAFVRQRGEGFARVRATSLEPGFRIQGGASGLDGFRVELTNVRAGRLSFSGKGVETEEIRESEGIVVLRADASQPGGAVLETGHNPAPGERLNFIAFSDTHLGADGATEQFALVRRQVNLRKPVFIVNAGDNVDVDEPAQWNVFEAETAKLEAPLFTTIGNHDSYLSTKLYRERMGNLYYAVNYGDTQVLMLDNAQKHNDATLRMDGPNPDEQWNWLEEQLALPAAHRFVFFHFPVYGNRSMLDPMYIRNTTLEEREKEVERMIGMFRGAGAEYVCFGHKHSARREVMEGITHIQLGGGGAPPDRTGERDLNFVHFFVDEKGARDYTVHIHAEPEEIKRIEFCELRETLPVGAKEPIIVHGVAGDRLVAVEPEFRILSGPGLIEDGCVFTADAPGRAVIGCSLGRLYVEAIIAIE
jgi:predicted phosphodiesterase